MSITKNLLTAHMDNQPPGDPSGGAVPWQILFLHFMHAKLRLGEATSAEHDPSCLGHLSAAAAPCANAPVAQPSLHRAGKINGGWWRIA